MDNHLKAWRAHRALSWLYALLVLATGYMAWRAGGPLRMDTPMFAGVLFIVLAGFHAVLGRAALARQPWARIASLFAGAVLVLAFPIGTLFGIYLIAACWNPWNHALTRGSPAASGWPQDAVRDRPRVSDRR